MRQGHYLRHNARNESVSSFICFDTETRPEKLPDGVERDHLWFGWACYQRTRRKGQWTRPQWHRFETHESFWEWVVSKVRDKETLYLFCHNTSYDLPVLDAFHALMDRGWKLNMAIIDAPPTILRWRNGSKSLKCLDTLNWWRVPLKKIGEMVGCPKLEMPAPDADPQQWEDYGKNDVEILRRAMLSWWGFLIENDLGNFRPTLASQAMGSYKHRFMAPRMLVHTDEDVLSMERSSYHGGRCECFRLGKHTGHFTLLDVNSMYPAVMRHRLYPTRLHWSAKHPTVESLAKHVERWCVTADVTLQTGNPAYAVVRNHKLVFPVGRFRVVLTTEEVRRALRLGEIRECHAFARYDAVDCFTEFVDWFYAQRITAASEGQETRSWQFKILMNSLYGKFGQSGRVWSKTEQTEDTANGCWTHVNADTGQVRKYRKLAGLVQSFEESPESAESMPAIAAHVTANARLLLWDYIEQAGRDHVYYCDTDSLLVDQIGLRRLRKHIDPSALGALKEEYKCREIELWGAKDYRFGEHTKHKGIRAKATQIDKSTWEQWQWSSLVGLLRTGEMNAPRRKLVTKTLKREYDKGLVMPDYRVAPLELNCETDSDT